MVPATDKEENVQLIGFYAGGKLLGVDILTVREILRDPTIEMTPNAPTFVQSCVRIRGEVIPMVNLKDRLGGTVSEDRTDPEWVLIATVNDRFLAFAVDSVTRILRIQADSILPAPDLILSGKRSHYIRGVCNSEFGMLVVIDLDRLLGADEIKALKGMALPQLT